MPASRASNMSDPHAGQPVLRSGPAPATAKLTMILGHGRGASAEDIVALAEALELDDVAYIAPQSAGRTWYPYSFLAPIGQNEPGISSGLAVFARLIAELQDDGVERERIALLGFSQGACLALEFAARHAARYAGVFGLSGGLIGPPGARLATTEDRSMALQSSWGAATSIRMFRWRACRNPPTFFAGLTAPWTNESTEAWAIRSMQTRSARSQRS